jgi:hypothetical protein
MIRLLTLLLFSLPAFGQAWSGILASDRAIDWTTVGIPGGIPSRTTVCANLTAGASTATIQAALNSCAAGQVVSFGAGTFVLTDSIYANKGITLRGQGPTSTTIVLCHDDTGPNAYAGCPDGSEANILLGYGTGWMGGIPGGAGQVSWTGGLTKGSTVLTVSSTTNLHAGQAIIIDENNPAWVFTDGVEGACTSGNSCGRNDSPPGFSGSANRAATQMTKIVSVDSSTQITILDPVGYTHTSGLTPQVFYWDAKNDSAYGNTEYASVENLKVNVLENDFAIAFTYCDYCWVKNVAMEDLGRSGVLYFYSYGGVVRDSYFSSTNAGAPTQYGIETIMSSNVLIENNILYNITTPILPADSYALVVGYNYANNTVAGNMFASYSAHLAHGMFGLVEGNVMNTITFDNSWGSSSHGTVFRNRAWGNGTNKTGYRLAVKFGAHSRFMNVVANVIGDPTFHTQYSCDDVTTTDAGVNLYDLGYWNGCGSLTDHDSVVRTSLVRWGNWDSVTWEANGDTNGIRYCTGSGAGNAACTASETANSDPTFPGLASPSSSFPSSFYNGVTTAHAACGTGLSFWKQPGGSCPKYPPIGPDVTCTTNCISNTASHASKIPAQICYDNTAKDGGGFLTAFDADDCYEADTGATIRPEPPTNVTVTFNDRLH